MGATVQGNKNGLVPPTSTPILKTLQQFSLIGFRFQAEDGKVDISSFEDLRNLIIVDQKKIGRPLVEKNICFMNEIIENSPDVLAEKLDAYDNIRSKIKNKILDMAENSMSLKILTHDVTLADGITQSRETLLALVPVTIEDRTFETEFIILPKAREIDYIPEKSDIVADMLSPPICGTEDNRENCNFVSVYVTCQLEALVAFLNLK
ncbi:hypothetical protein CDAR_13401 [Caerostris darwini]|uniref:Uncharacterized protein n=1 Tax=Caerostris darwini TaxID=1538125 RepID=A0AAV4TEP8_9ARAC|nr:hypothetical protein CDAR_13401 [Caerostris darwini]